MTVLSDTIDGQVETLAAAAAADISSAVATLSGARRAHLVGTGTSQHAAELGAAMLRRAGVDATWSSSASFAAEDLPADRSDVVIVLTHTGATAYARAVRQRAVVRAEPLVSITGHGVGWPEAIEVAPQEKSETYTASYTAALLVLARIAGALGSTAFGPAAIEATLAAATTALSHTWDQPPPKRLLVITGPGPAGVTAREGALKLREAARVVSEGFEAEQLLHGSAVPLDARDRLVLLQPAADPDGLTQLIGDAAAETGVDVVTVDEPAPLDPLLQQIPLTIRLQRLAAIWADERGEDPDHAIVGPWSDDRLWTTGSALS